MDIMDKPTDQYILDVEQRLIEQSKRANQYFSYKNETKKFYTDLMQYMIENKLRNLGKIDLCFFKSGYYLTVREDFFDKVKTIKEVEESLTIEEQDRLVYGFISDAEALNVDCTKNMIIDNLIGKMSKYEVQQTITRLVITGINDKKIKHQDGAYSVVNDNESR